LRYNDAHFSLLLTVNLEDINGAILMSQHQQSLLQGQKLPGDFRLVVCVVTTL
jgi:hypothetical protein